MAILQLSEATMNRLREVAAQQEQSVDEIAEKALIKYLSGVDQATAEMDEPDLDSITAEMIAADPSLAELFHARGLMTPDEYERTLTLIGFLDTDETDMSETVRETLANLTHSEYDWTLKDDRFNTD